MHLIALTASAPGTGRRTVAVSHTYSNPALAVADQVGRCGERHGEEWELTVNLGGGTGLALFSASDARRVALVNPHYASVRAVAAHLFEATPSAGQLATVGRLIAGHTYTYGIDAYGPGPEDGTRTTRGPAGLPRAKAIDYLTHRMRDLSRNGVCPNESGNWHVFANEILDRADAETTRPQSAGVSEEYGVIVTSEPIPTLGKAPDIGGAVEASEGRR